MLKSNLFDCRAPWAVAFVLTVGAALAISPDAMAQNQNNNNGNLGFSRAVGGVFIDADGVLRFVQADELHELAGLRQRALVQVPADLNRPSEFRKVSLKGLNDVLAEAKRTGAKLPDEVVCLAGLQRIRYVFVYPEQKDIVLVGYGEGWKVDELGNVVGVNTGRPVLMLEDLMVSLRSATQAANGGIWCSIDPTSEGLRRLQELNARGLPQEPSADLIQSMEQAMGPQTVSVGGVPATSHFAHILIAADYRMKRLAMNFDASPVKGLPSYLAMAPASGRGVQNTMPRWWLAASYDPLLTDVDGLAWELRGQGVKTMTEDDVLAADGSKKHTGKASAPAQKWADAMTAKYEELSVKQPIFGELRNMMDLAVVSALIVKENLAAKSGLEMPMLAEANDYPAAIFETPKQTDSKVSFIQKRGRYVLFTSGGVKIDSWFIVDSKEVSAEIAPIRAEANVARGAEWWWN